MTAPDRASRRAADRRARARTRRRALAGLAALSGLAGAIVGAGAGDEEQEGSAAAVSAHCAEPGEAGIRQAAGQMVMVRLESEVTDSLRRAAARGEIGGVVVFPPPGASEGDVGHAIERLQRASARGGQPPLLAATDQEGGEVKRFLDAPPDLAPAEVDAAGGEAEAEAEAERQGAATGRFLSNLGINVDLAPVLDVPAAEGSFLGSRTFGDDPGTVASLGLAFIRGLASAGVAATAKHFPGLGLAPVNTDFGPSAVEAPRPALRPGLEPFAEAIAAGVPLVMVGHASYPALGSPGPASLDRGVVKRRLRERLGFTGVAITDDLGAAAIEAVAHPKEAVLDAVEAGEDILLFASEERPDAVDPIAEAVAAGRIEPDRVRQACTRVVTLKDTL